MENLQQWLRGRRVALARDSLRSYELARFTPAERSVAVQIFGGDPDKMAHAPL